MEEREKNAPVKTYRAHGVEVSVWENIGPNGKYYTVSCQRRYKDNSEGWKSTKTFRLGDLPALSLLTGEAFREFKIQTREGVGDEPSEDNSF